MDALNSRGILFLSTVRANRLKGIAFKEEKVLKREGRGNSDYTIEQNTQSIAIKWYDKPIHLLSNYAGIEPLDTCSRWDAKQNIRVEIRRPFAVKEYNKFMGGVDLSDMLIELYRIDFKSRKWYMHIFFYLLDMTVVNSWLLYRRVKSSHQSGKMMSLLDFKEYIASGLMSSSTTPKKGRPSISKEPISRKRKSCHPADSVRLDGNSHWPGWTSKPQRCRKCIKAHSKMECMKCKVNLYCTKDRNCFYAYHQK